MHPTLNGVVSYSALPGRGKMAFEYEVVRLWERPADEFLNGPLGTTPLAVLGALPPGVSEVDGLTHVAQRLVERYQREATTERARKLLTSAYVLTGLRVKERAVALNIFRGVQAMHESVTYMAIVDEGQEKHAKRMLLHLAQKRFGPPDKAATARLAAIAEDVERLDRMIERLFDGSAASWQDLLDTP